MSQISPEIVNPCRFCTAKCCRNLTVVLTIPEAVRLVKATGLPPQDIMDFSDKVDSRKTPHYPLLVKGEGQLREYFIVLKHKGNDCIFLQDDLRCGIYNDRPNVCRLYPFDLDGGEMKKGALCPVEFKREESVGGDAKQLRQDLYDHGVMARKWIDSFGSKKPDMEKFGEYFGSP